MKHASALTSNSVFVKHSASLAIAFVAVAVTTIGTANSQPSNLPPWEHRDFLPPDMISTDMMSTIRPARSVAYLAAPRSYRPDPTLSYISADEPVVQAGFPPMPNHADVYDPAHASIPVTQSAPNLALPNDASGTNQNKHLKRNRSVEQTTIAPAMPMNRVIHF